jgi:hypothetical protein
MSILDGMIAGQDILDQDEIRMTIVGITTKIIGALVDVVMKEAETIHVGFIVDIKNLLLKDLKENPKKNVLAIPHQEQRPLVLYS